MGTSFTQICIPWIMFVWNLSKLVWSSVWMWEQQETGGAVRTALISTDVYLRKGKTFKQWPSSTPVHIFVKYNLIWGNQGIFINPKTAPHSCNIELKLKKNRSQAYSIIIRKKTHCKRRWYDIRFSSYLCSTLTSATPALNDWVQSLTLAR